MAAGAQTAKIAVGSPEDAVRLAWVDVAKGLCIILVVMMHSTLGTGIAMEGEGFLHTVVTFARPFRIPDFFLLSGLFLGRVIDRDWRLFADRRVVHFVYFYVLWVLIQSASKYGQIVDGAGPGAFVAHLAEAVIEPYSTLWFIYLLAVFSVTTKLLRRVPAFWLLAGAAVLQILPIHTGAELVDEFCDRYVWFLVGYLFAERIFGFAGLVQRHARTALIGLALWAVIEAVMVFTPTGIAAIPTPSHIPVLSLILSGAGALAIVAIGALLSRAGGPVTAALRACGQRSIVIYLGFFLPMALTRTLIVKSGAITDIGVASLIVTIVAILVPLAFERMIRHTPLAFLFKRPKAFHIVPERTAPAGGTFKAA
ncbi:acyltransferase family protein [Methylobacterium sp. BTF04]|uniref:acyltransferase family protein n=1 Tax=Methylobacterium sp. BTF04 TaxID=2708300 RepID=UPI0013CFC7A9|nr:acyltransferase family protein [Methylobacterium sp. BTF04]NEU13454.1 acyltransferase family protein [Methylobacterium sp. BTF04]